MATADDLEQAIEQYQLALRELVKGNPEPNKMMFSHREDVTLLNPLGPPARGWEEIAETMERVASQVSEGEIVAFETVATYVTLELACIVWVERNRGKVGGRQDIAPWSLRVTTVFRPEDGTWKIVHRHADAITMARPIESVLQE